jgi:hypothetical protein
VSDAVCTRCDVRYDPSLTRWSCPVCDQSAPAAATGRRRLREWDDPDSRLLAIVAAATIGNVLLLAILAFAVLHN